MTLKVFTGGVDVVYTSSLDLPLHDLETFSLLQRFLETHNEAAFGCRVRRVFAEPLNNSRSGSLVLKIIPLLGDRKSDKKAIVAKISSLRDGTLEQENYDRYAKPFLPSKLRPDHLGFLGSAERSIICYSLIGSRGKAGGTLTSYLRCGETSKLTFFLRTTLAAIRAGWYSSHQIEWKADLAQRYLDRFFAGGRAALEAKNKLKTYAEQYLGAHAKAGGFAIEGDWFPSPHRVLFEHGKKRPYRSCIIHGDMNSDNIIFGEEEASAALVDFQMTGKGHIFEDLVSLELSSRMHYAEDGALRDIFATEKMITQGEPQQTHYARAVQHVRRSAADCFGPIRDDPTYNFSVAAIGLRVLQIPELSPIARARTAAAVLWAAKALSG